MTYQFDRFALDTDTRRLLRDGQELHLSPKAFDLLRLLIEGRARVDRAIECLFHQARMQLELPVVHANEVDNRVDAGRRCLHRRRIVGIPGDNLGERIAAEGCSQRISRSADHSVWPTLGADCLRDALADRPGGTKERDLVHGRGPRFVVKPVARTTYKCTVIFKKAKIDRCSRYRT